MAGTSSSDALTQTLITTISALRDAIVKTNEGTAARNTRNIRQQYGGMNTESSAEQAEQRKRQQILRDQISSLRGAKNAAQDAADALGKLSTSAAEARKISQRTHVLTEAAARSVAEEASNSAAGLNRFSTNIVSAYENIAKGSADAQAVLTNILGQAGNDVIQAEQQITDFSKSMALMQDILADSNATAEEFESALTMMASAGVDTQVAFGKTTDEMRDLFPAMQALRQNAGDVGLAQQDLVADILALDNDIATATSADAARELQSKRDLLTRSLATLNDEVVDAAGNIHHITAVASEMLTKVNKHQIEANKSIVTGTEVTHRQNKAMTALSKITGAVTGLFMQLAPALAGASFAGGIKLMYEEAITSMRYGSEQAEKMFSDFTAAQMNMTREELAQLEIQNRQAQLASGTQEQYRESLLASAKQFSGTVGSIEDAGKAINEMRGTVAMWGDTTMSVAEQADKSFEKLFSGVSGVSIGFKTLGWKVEEVNELMRGFATDPDVLYNTRLLPAQQRAAYQESLALQVQVNQAMGMTQEQAREAAKALGKLGAEKPAERLKKAYRMAALAGAYGVEGGSQYIQAAMRGFRGKGDQEFGTKFQSTLSNTMSASMSQSFESELFGSTISDKMGLTELLAQFNTTTGTQLKLSEQAIKDQQAIQNRIAGTYDEFVTALKVFNGFLGKTGVTMAGAGAAMGGLGALGTFLGPLAAGWMIKGALAKTAGGAANVAPLAQGLGKRLLGKGLVGTLVGGAVMGGSMLAGGGGEGGGQEQSWFTGRNVGSVVGSIAGGLMGAGVASVATGIAGGVIGEQIGGWIDDNLINKPASEKNATESVMENTSAQTEHQSKIASSSEKTATAASSTDKKFDNLLDLTRQSVDAQKKIADILLLTDEQKQQAQAYARVDNMRLNALGTRYAQ